MRAAVRIFLVFCFAVIWPLITLAPTNSFAQAPSNQFGGTVQAPGGAAGATGGYTAPGPPPPAPPACPPPSTLDAAASQIWGQPLCTIPLTCSCGGPPVSIGTSGQISCCPSGYSAESSDGASSTCCPSHPASVAVMNGICMTEVPCGPNNSRMCFASTGSSPVTVPLTGCPAGFSVYQDTGAPICAQVAACPPGYYLTDNTCVTLGNQTVTPTPTIPIVRPEPFCRAGYVKASNGSCCPVDRLTPNGTCCPEGVRPQGNGSCAPLPPVETPALVAAPTVPGSSDHRARCGIGVMGREGFA